jgi:uncharacterized protein YciI
MRVLLTCFAAMATILAVPAVRVAQDAAESQPSEQYVYVLKLIPRLYEPTNWTDEENAIVGDHFRRLQALLAEGKLILAGRTANTDEKGLGLVILEVENEAEARRLMEEDPVVVSGIMTAELFPYRAALLRGSD